ncbi:hypothetical protein [Streptomyces sp. NBC_01262]|uniref:hypothetical protein n=1 Tax=Streptomyces sp. NBC_01262 TaxID=2903803 RepID=UPI002E32E4C1|nr:hypothetical protein [Streptomyces sp. NBC_01262]
MQVTKYVGECDENECPGVFTTDRDSYLFQGDAVTDHGLTIPAGEGVVELPASLVKALVEKAVRDGLV